MGQLTARYRMSRYGTIALTLEQRQSDSLIVGVEQKLARYSYYQSNDRLPPQGVWGYITQRWEEWVDGPEIELRFPAHRHVLWADGTLQIVNGVCTNGNTLYDAILTELAKKPNIPPLAPSIPPLQSPLSTTARALTIRPGALSFRSNVEGDFDVVLWWSSPIDDGSDQCSTSPIPDIPVPPLPEPIPAPSGPWYGAPALPPIQGNPGDPSLPGTSQVPPGYAVGDNPKPVPVTTKWAAKYLYRPPGFDSPLVGFGFNSPDALVNLPNPYTTGPPQGGTGGGAGPTRVGFYRNGSYVGDFVDVFPESIEFVQIPV